MEQKNNPEDMGEIKEQNSNIVGQIIGFLKGGVFIQWEKSTKNSRLRVGRASEHA